MNKQQKKSLPPISILALGWSSVLFCNKSKSSFFFFFFSSVTMTMGIISSAFLFSAFFTLPHPSSPQAPEVTLYVFFDNLLVVLSPTLSLPMVVVAPLKSDCCFRKSMGFFGGKNSNKATPLNILHFPPFICTHGVHKAWGGGLVGWLV